MTDILVFPAYFPPNCPPDDATNQELHVYRFCIQKDVVTEEDFLSYYQLDPVKWEGYINAYGLSVLLSEKECEKGIRLPAIRKKFKSYASGITYINKGVIKRTPTKQYFSHCTWWLYDGVKPHTYFVICA